MLLEQVCQVVQVLLGWLEAPLLWLLASDQFLDSFPLRIEALNLRGWSKPRLGLISLAGGPLHIDSFYQGSNMLAFALETGDTPTPDVCWLAGGRI